MNTTQKTAIPVKKNLPSFNGTAHLYRLDPPYVDTDWEGRERGTHEHVIVSATFVPFGGPETYIFPADAEGNIADWGELDGSQKGTLDHEQVLRDAGYEVKA
jgi:hypothetical protein